MLYVRLVGCALSFGCHKENSAQNNLHHRLAGVFRVLSWEDGNNYAFLLMSLRADRPGQADVRAIEQTIALQILKTLGRYILTGEGAIKQLKDVTPPLIRLRAQNHRLDPLLITAAMPVYIMV